MRATREYREGLKSRVRSCGSWLDRMRVPGCGVPPPPDSRRFNSNNSQITDNTNCNDCNNNNNNNNNNIHNNNNDNVNEIGSPKSVESNDVGYHHARRNQRNEERTSGGCLEHHGTGCLTAETARPTPLPPQKRSNGQPPLFFAEFFSRVLARRKLPTPKTRVAGVVGGSRADPTNRSSSSSRAAFRSRLLCSRSWSEVIVV